MHSGAGPCDVEPIEPEGEVVDVPIFNDGVMGWPCMYCVGLNLRDYTDLCPWYCWVILEIPGLAEIIGDNSPTCFVSVCDSNPSDQ